MTVKPRSSGFLRFHGQNTQSPYIRQGDTCEVIDYIPDQNLTPAQRQKLSDWLDGKEGAKFPTMRNPDLRAVLSAMRQHLEADGSRDEARKYEQLWERAQETGSRALKIAHNRFERIMELQAENDKLRRERDEARAERDHLERRVVSLERCIKNQGEAIDFWRDSLRRVEEERDEARAECEQLRDAGGMDKPEWALDESDVEDVRDICDAVAEAANKTRPPRRIKVVIPAGTAHLEADEWIAEDGHLKVYRAGEEIAEFPPGQWLRVMAE